MLDRFGQLNNDSQVVFQDIKILTRGLLSFTTLRRLFIGNSMYGSLFTLYMCIILKQTLGVGKWGTRPFLVYMFAKKLQITTSVFVLFFINSKRFKCGRGENCSVIEGIQSIFKNNK